MVAICIEKEILNFRKLQNRQNIDKAKKEKERIKRDLEIKSINRILKKKIISVRELNFLTRCSRIDLVTKVGMDFIDFKIVNKYLVVYNDKINLIYC